jgi:hypothetical protein
MLTLLDESALAGRVRDASSLFTMAKNSKPNGGHTIAVAYGESKLYTRHTIVVALSPDSRYSPEVLSEANTPPIGLYVCSAELLPLKMRVMSCLTYHNEN